jgi:glycosyltransferase involved in cell wall biosynthesis
MTRLARYISRHDIRIVHGTEKPRDAFYGLLLARLTGARAITHLHVKAEGWMSPLVRWSLRRADGVIAISEFVARSAANMGCDASRTYTVLNALDHRAWSLESDGVSIRHEFAIPDAAPVISIISRVCPWKGHELLLDALACLRSTVPEFRLLVVGEDDPRATPGGGSYSARLRSRCAELDLQENVIFTGFRSDTSELLAASDIFAMPSFEEPFGVVFLEAMAMGKPVVALRSGGAPQVVEHTLSGLLSDPDDVRTLSQNLQRLILDPDLRQRMGLYGQDVVRTNFTPERLARDMEAVYSSVMKNGANTNCGSRRVPLFRTSRGSEQVSLR